MILNVFRSFFQLHDIKASYGREAGLTSRTEDAVAMGGWPVYKC